MHEVERRGELPCHLTPGLGSDKSPMTTLEAPSRDSHHIVSGLAFEMGGKAL